MREILIGVLPVLGVLMGAMLQHVLAKSKEREGQFTVYRHEAYADFLKAVAATAINPANITHVADAKARMAVYASNSVIEKLAAFDASGATLANEESRILFAEVAQQMRSESGNGNTKIKDGALSSLLFGQTKK
jgi:hypothetical protein